MMNDTNLESVFQHCPDQTLDVATVRAATQSRVDDTQLVVSGFVTVTFWRGPIDTCGASVLHFQVMACIVDWDLTILAYIDLK